MKILGGLLIMLALAFSTGCFRETLDLTAAPQENIATLTDDNFGAEVLESKVPALVDFWAPWCGPCLKMNSVMAELAKEYKGQPIKFGALNTSENRKSSEKYKVERIPYFVIFKNGKAVEGIVGAISKEKLKQMIERHIER